MVITNNAALNRQIDSAADNLWKVFNGLTDDKWCTVAGIKVPFETAVTERDLSNTIRNYVIDRQGILSKLKNSCVNSFSRVINTLVQIDRDLCSAASMIPSDQLVSAYKGLAKDLNQQYPALNFQVEVDQSVLLGAKYVSLKEDVINLYDKVKDIYNKDAEERKQYSRDLLVKYGLPTGSAYIEDTAGLIKYLLGRNDTDNPSIKLMSTTYAILVAIIAIMVAPAVAILTTASLLHYYLFVKPKQFEEDDEVLQKVSEVTYNLDNDIGRYV